MGGGAWPFVVDGVICLVNSVNEGTLGESRFAVNFLEGLLVSNQSREDNNRSVMPLEVLGHTCATLTMSESVSFTGRCG